MPSAAALRLQIENALQTRIPGALTPRPRILRDLAATGIPELDTLLEGGLPIGAITELVGPLSSGRTTLTMAVLAELTQADKTVAWIDVADALDPESAAAAGIDLERQLWVRCGGGPTSAAPATTPSSPKPNTGAALLVEGSYTPAPGGGCGSPHPRGEARGLPQAVDAFLQPQTFSRTLPPNHHYNVSRKDRSIGTPSAPNRKILDRQPQDPRPFPRRAQDREEQIPTDRQPSRRQTLQAAQLANTAAAARNRPQAGHWTDNKNNAHGRSLHTPPNAIAAGLPRFREMEARAQGQGHGLERKPIQWKPTLESLVPAQAEPAASPQKRSASLAGEPPPNLGRTGSPIWKALDQALRATDLLLAAGGFSAIVLDLGNTPPEFAWRIPLATWFRFRAGADRARTVFLLLTQHPCARSSAELVLRCSSIESQSATTVLTGARFHIAVDRRRFENNTLPEHSVAEPTPNGKLHLVTTRKQPQRDRTVDWQRSTSWTGTTPRGPQ